jgi:hypothetical protein
VAIDQAAALATSQVRKGVAAGLLAATLMIGLTSLALIVGPRLGIRRLSEQGSVALLRGRPRYALFFFVLHLIYGGTAGALFAVTEEKPSTAKGLVYGLLLWAVALIVYSPLVGWDLLERSSHSISISFLAAHLLYGATIGFLLAPNRPQRGRLRLSSREVMNPPTKRPAAPKSSRNVTPPCTLSSRLPARNPMIAGKPAPQSQRPSTHIDVQK